MKRKRANHAWLAGTVVLMVTSCIATDQPAGQYTGTPALRTPYDSKYERVRLYLREARVKIEYTPEQDHRDYWQLPEESEALGTGDCEDMAIWLYIKMKRAGLEPVRLCIGKHTPGADEMHAWLIWRDRNRLYILDPSVTGELLPSEKAEPGTYLPYYSYDADRKWRHKAASR